MGRRINRIVEVISILLVIIITIYALTPIAKATVDELEGLTYSTTTYNSSSNTYNTYNTYNYEFKNINSAVLGRGNQYFKYDKIPDKKINVFDSCKSKLNYFNILKAPPEIIDPPDTPLPVPFSTNGIDVSRWQNTIDWGKVKASGFTFAMIRAGYGRYHHQEDAKFRINMENAQKAGVNRGVYWYSYAVSPEEARIEAQVCLDIIRGYKLEYPIMFDIEENMQKELGKEVVSDIIEAFCTTVEAQGYYVGVYSYKNFLTNYVRQDILDRYDVWLAEWCEQPTYKGNYGIWQYTSNGLVNGIEGRVDLNISYKNYPEIMKKNGLNGY